MSNTIISHKSRISRCLRVIKEDNLTNRFHKFGSHFMIQKLVCDHSNRMMDHSCNRWLNTRISAKNVSRWDAINKELRISNEGFDSSVVEEEQLSLTMCVYGPNQEVMNSKLFARCAMNANNIKLEGTPPAIIFQLSLSIRGWLCKIHAQWISTHYFRAKEMSILLGNDVVGSPYEIDWAFKQEIKEIISKIGGKIIPKTHSHFTLVTDQLEGLKNMLKLCKWWWR